MNITFLGAAETVTGSKVLVEHKGTRVLLDCGLFQGLKKLRLRNWSPFPIDPKSLDAVLLSHAHLDHSGYLPRLYSKGFRSPIYCTSATRDLSKILLEDSGYLQEEDARWANHMGFSKHHPALPLYTQKDAHTCLRAFESRPFDQPFQVGSLQVTFVPAGHILGAASILVQADNKTLLYSGDLGRYEDILMAPPQTPPHADFVIMESTYGDRQHAKVDPVEALGKVVEEVIEKKSVLLIPSFAVGRTQALLKCFWDLFEKNKNLKIPLFVNSPMATDVTELYQEFHSFHNLSKEHCKEVCQLPQFARTVDQSKLLNSKKGPIAIISASGMLAGGRVLHHMKTYAPHEDNIILLAGFQAAGTRGAHILQGHREVKIHGQIVLVRAKVEHFDFLSAHADQDDLAKWLSHLRQPPKKIFLVHGEPSASDNLRFNLQQRYPSTDITTAEDRQTITL